MASIVGDQIAIRQFKDAIRPNKGSLTNRSTESELCCSACDGGNEDEEDEADEADEALDDRSKERSMPALRIKGNKF
jgi:hypothetical protein